MSSCDSGMVEVLIFVGGARSACMHPVCTPDQDGENADLFFSHIDKGLEQRNRRRDGMMEV